MFRSAGLTDRLWRLIEPSDEMEEAESGDGRQLADSRTLAAHLCARVTVVVGVVHVLFVGSRGCRSSACRLLVRRFPLCVSTAVPDLDFNRWSQRILLLTFRHLICSPLHDAAPLEPCVSPSSRTRTSASLGYDSWLALPVFTS